MDEQKAKFILSAGTPRPEDADQEAFRDAAELAETSPELRRWKDDQQRLSDALHRRLNEVPVPAGLRSRILAGESVSRVQSRWRRSSLLALAAALVALLGIVVWQLLPFTAHSGEKTFAALRADMSDFLTGPFRLELQSTRLDRLQAHLADKHQFIDYAVPAGLHNRTGVGCRVIDWRGSRVALICFSVDGELVHLMVLPKGQLMEPSVDLGTHQQGEWVTTGWEDSRNVYLVATKGSEAFLDELLKSGTGG